MLSLPSIAASVGGLGRGQRMLRGLGVKATVAPRATVSTSCSASSSSSSVAVHPQIATAAATAVSSIGAVVTAGVGVAVSVGVAASATHSKSLMPVGVMRNKSGRIARALGGKGKGGGSQLSKIGSCRVAKSRLRYSGAGAVRSGRTGCDHDRLHRQQKRVVRTDGSTATVGRVGRGRIESRNRRSNDRRWKAAGASPHEQPATFRNAADSDYFLLGWTAGFDTRERRIYHCARWHFTLFLKLNYKAARLSPIQVGSRP